jgi:hypothetical protein
MEIEVSFAKNSINQSILPKENAYFRDVGGLSSFIELVVLPFIHGLWNFWNDSFELDNLFCFVFFFGSSL